MKSSLTIIAIALAMLPQAIFAAENVLGDWEFEYKSVLPPGKPFSGTLTIIRRSDGSHGGNLSTTKGESLLWNVKMEDGTLLFTDREALPHGREFQRTYRVTAHGTKMTGAVLEIVHRFDLVGELQGQPKPGPDAYLGTWKIDVTVAKTAKEWMTISKKPDGSLAAKWHYIVNEKGRRLVYDVKFTDNNLSFTDKIESPVGTFIAAFQGAVKGDRIEGTYMEAHNKSKPMWANRIVPAKAPDPNKPDPNS